MSLRDKLDRIVLRGDELQHTLNTASPDLSADEFRRVSQEYAHVQPLIARITELRDAERARVDAEGLLADPDMRELAEDELRSLRERIPALEQELRIAMLPRDEADARSAILEIRPAAGGDEAALFAAELFGAYRRFAGAEGWRFELLEYDESELGGLRGGSAEINGRDVFSKLKHESGVHRVQRVPRTETQGRIHTSTVTVAILPEAEEVDVDIDEGDLRIDVYRASGAGGQHVNKTESAVRITHLPTGTVVAMQEEKSQHKNRAKAMKILRARLYERQRAAAHSARSADRRAQVGTGDRSERVRTYNFPQGRVSDHRINLTSYSIDKVMNGEFGEFVDALRQEEVAALLAESE